MLRRGAIGLVVLLVTWLAPARALACSCLVMSPCESLWLGDAATSRVVFEATVVAIEQDVGPPIEPDGRRYPVRRVTLKDLKSWIGEPATVVTTGAGSGDCGYTFTVGRRYLIDAWRNPDTAGLGTGICGFTKPLEESAEVVTYLESLSKPSPGATVSGTVRLVSGSWFGPDERKPIPGVRVLLHGPRSTTTRSARDGSFAFAGLPPGAYQLSVEVEGRPELAVPEPEEFRLPNAHACHTSWVNLEINSAIEGTVVDQAGAPVHGVYLALRPAEPEPNEPPRYQPASSDELGRYAFRNLPPGRYQVGVNLSLGPRAESPFAVTYPLDPSGRPEVVELEVGALHHSRPIVVSRLEPVTVQGQVGWPDGRPGSGCLVLAQAMAESRPGLGVAVTAGADGRFEIDLLKGQRYRMRAANCTPLGAEADSVAGEGFVRLVLRDPR
jgi:hypothetical protein